MSENKDVIKYTLTREPIEECENISEMYLALYHAKINFEQFMSGERPAPSQVYKNDPVKRAALYRENALTAMMGELVINQHFHGKVKGMMEFHKSRTEHNLHPARGDNGSDIRGYPIDMKTSYLRKENQDCMGKTLAVRKRERYDNNIYVLGLIKKFDIVVSGGINPLPIHDTVDKWMMVTVHIVGWAYSEQFPPIDQPNGKYEFKGACVQYSYQLQPMSTFPYETEGMKNIQGELITL